MKQKNSLLALSLAALLTLSLTACNQEVKDPSVGESSASSSIETPLPSTNEGNDANLDAGDETPDGQSGMTEKPSVGGSTNGNISGGTVVIPGDRIPSGSSNRIIIGGTPPAGNGNVVVRGAVPAGGIRGSGSIPQ